MSSPALISNSMRSRSESSTYAGGHSGLTERARRIGASLPSLVELDRQRVRLGGFSKFVELAWPQIEEAEFIGGWHIDLVCAHFAAAARGEILEMVVNVPPGTSKSTIGSVMFVAWVWIEEPWRRFMYLSYSQDLSWDHSEKTRLLVDGPWYRARWAARIDTGRTNTKTEWHTTAGGWRFCTTPTGKATGLHPHFVVGDDPNAPRDADGGKGATSVALTRVTKLWASTFSTRGANIATVVRIVIQQRIAQLDLSGSMLKRGAVHVRLAMEFDGERCETQWGRDPRTEIGELLCPARFDAHAVARLKKDLETAANIAAQLQQSPFSKAGETFKLSALRLYTELPAGWEGGHWIQVWDCTFTRAETSDFVSGTVWVRVGRYFYIVDRIHGRMGLHETKEAIREMTRRWPLTAAEILVEDKANGPAVVELLEDELAGIRVVSGGNKESRALAAGEAWDDHRVFAPADAEWMPEWRQEHIAWPHGANDDDVDGGGHALRYLRESDTSDYEEWVMSMKR